MMCYEKQPHATLRGATEEAVEQFLAGRGVQRPYSCERCERYHLTTKPLTGGPALSEAMLRALASSVGATNVLRMTEEGTR